MFELKVEGLEPLEKNFEKYHEQLLDLHKKVPEELVEWQRVDMRRKYPNTKVDETPESVQAVTMVWPRSRLEQEPGYVKPKQLGFTTMRKPYTRGGPKQYRVAGMRFASTRPILREELYRKLVDRMTKLATEGLKWPST